ncbi:hypothetical protein ACFPTY_10945 [Halomonas beimenensis]|uniref:Phage tail fiber protein n=1 Tax=Halomonas beimenensis TaxID=475662 RepID=A0A291P9C5_9GAMM|nr:hypothetical protein [Halomonas beimenensis]ATJ83526.1 phage tail fiber protein [Halomonas beimenensis]
MSINLTPVLREEYERLFETCHIRPERSRSVEQAADRLLEHRERYRQVGERQGVPWVFVGLVHQMESGGDFGCHLHNGDPLTARTVHVPAGRPRRGSPPFTWEDSAVDALAMKRLNRHPDWSLAGLLYQLERYNGWGYRRFHPEVLSPYLWSFSTHYDRGKYVADGRWSDTAVSRQAGAAVILRRLAELGEVAFPERPARGPLKPLVPRYAMRRSTKAETVARVEALQRWLNSFPSLFVAVDGVPGRRTSEAYRLATGHYLPGDPRIEQG